MMNVQRFLGTWDWIPNQSFQTSVFFVMLMPSLLQAANLQVPFELENADVLPAHVGNPRLKSFSTVVDTKYNGSGNIESLSTPLNRTLSWQDVLKSQGTTADGDVKRASIRSILDAAGLNVTEGGPGSTSGDILTSVKAYVPVLCYGLSDKLSLALAVPVIKVDMRADAGFVANESGQKFFRTVNQVTSPVKADEVAEQLNHSVSRKLTDLGYLPIQSKAFSGIGDIRIVGKYQYYKDEFHRVTFKPEILLPTGKGPNPDDVLDLPLGDSRYGIGLTTLYDRKRIFEELGTNTYVGYQALLPNKMEKRIPTEQENLSADKDQVTRNLDSRIFLGGNLNYAFPTTGLSLGVGYHFQFLTRSTFSGNNPEFQDRYQLISRQTPSQTLHSATATAGFSSVDFYKAKRFFYPFQAAVSYNRVLSGRNVPRGEVVAGELVLFF